MIGCVIKHWSKLLKNVSVILKFEVCKSIPVRENETDPEEEEPLNNRGKNLFSAWNYYIYWFVIWEEGFLFCTSKL